MASTSTPPKTTSDVRCPGCGKSFTGERGLRSHQSAKFQASACKRPV